jgi:hypothetical protein
MYFIDLSIIVMVPVWSLSSGGGEILVELDEGVRHYAKDAHAYGVRRQRHAISADRGHVHKGWQEKKTVESELHYFYCDRL